MANVSEVIQYTDNGELTLAAYTYGVAHPSGYPLFLTIGKLWSLLPFGLKPIYQLNILSSVFTALGAVAFGFAAYEFTKSSSNVKRSWIIPFSSMIYGLMPLTMAQSYFYEVYSLHLLIFNLIAYSFLKAENTSNQKFLLLGIFLILLSFANHLTSIVYLPALLILALMLRNQVDMPKVLKLSLAFTIICAAWYLTLILRSASNPPLDWGGVSRGFDKFWYHASGKQYSIWLFTGENLKENLINFITNLPKETAYFGLVFFLVGSFSIFKNFTKVRIFLVSIMVLCIFYAVNYSIHDIDNYFIPAMSVILLLTINGLVFLFDQKRTWLMVSFYVYIFIALIAANLTAKPNKLVDLYTNSIIDNIEKDAIVLSAQWDYWNSAFWYYKYAEGKRTDVCLLEQELFRRTWMKKFITQNYNDLYQLSKKSINAYFDYLELFESGQSFDPNQIQYLYVNMFNDIIEKNYGRRPIYLSIDIMQKEQSIASNYAKIPFGHLFVLSSENKFYEYDPIIFGAGKFIDEIGTITQKTHLDEGIIGLISLNYTNMARYFEYNGNIEKASFCYKSAFAINPNNNLALEGYKKYGQENKGNQ